MTGLKYTENTKKTSSSCSNVGRPIKGFEKRRIEILNAEPVEFVEFLRASFEDICKQGGEVVLMCKQNGTLAEFVRGLNNWNVVKAQFPNKEPRYRTLESFEADYESYRAKFYAFQRQVRNNL